MAEYTVQTTSRSGLNPTANAVASSDTFDNDGRTILRIINGSGGSVTVTLVTQLTVDSQAVADRTVAVPASEARVIGPFPQNVYNDADGHMTVQYSATTSVTAEVYNLGST